MVDATFGGGGHTALLLDRHPGITVIGLDRDPAANANAASLGPRLNVMQSDFRHLGEALDRAGVDRIEGALFDLGVSSRQLDDPGRGLLLPPPRAARHADGPRRGDHRRRRGQRLGCRALAGAIRRYGEEPHASRIAAAIVAARPVDRHRSTGRGRGRGSAGEGAEPADTPPAAHSRQSGSWSTRSSPHWRRVSRRPCSD